ncbi:phosphate acyltransferase PlsX [Mycoplasma sp. CSL10137]|uniref:phosphate acyltransferase PlsX n=1 Tax=unclassified Mycoplasma TaxID=2683645 RepID=UPI00197BF913|nr:MULTISPECIES: phosphate acyltransferase PlsX [unclassified Mycoplasma]MBN4083771.1 phosphate acyltransferase PlsX [Mycoplasma sp. CSL10137]MBN4084175.1 phosphate acyltransferase PlsX [Mycoplasma sp. CSL10166]MBU4692638.1 phosphate acyltransferase PlsX [Mycoplasma sp. CSL7491-lung]
MEFKYKIALDANGLDFGSIEALEGSKIFVKDNPDTEIHLVGDFKNIDISLLPKNIKIYQNNIKSANPRDIRQVMRENISINEAIDLVRNNIAQGIISGGDSGSYLASLTFKLKRLENISRPAFMGMAYSIRNEILLMLDIGASLEAKPEYYLEWAKLANRFYKVMYKVEEPKITLLNIGVEEYKGTQILRDAHELLKNENFNYIGFSEPRELLQGKYQIALTDGYGGNLVTKSYEGALLTFKDALKIHVQRSFISKIGALLMKGAFKKVAKTFDYRNIASAWVIGVNAPAIKIHGASDRKAVLVALNNMKNALEFDLMSHLKG